MKQYHVNGMTCAACVSRVEKAVNRVPGVTSCSVSLLTNSMGIEGTASDASIIAAVGKAGYEASPKDEHSRLASPSQNMDDFTDRETPALKKRLLASLLFLAVLMYFSMGHMMWNWPLPAFFNGNHVAMGLLQLLLAVIIMVINQKFFINGTKSLLAGSPNMDTLVALGSGASFLYSVYALFAMTGAQVSGNSEAVMSYMHEFYFESAAMILTLITVGKMLEARSKGKTTDALKSLMQLAPKTAVIIKDGEETTVSIEQVQKDAPAYNAGIQPGDLLIEVDGNDTTTLSLQEAVNLIKKGENKEVLLLVGRGTDTFEVTVEKTSVQIESVTYEMKEDNIGYIAVSQFIENTGDKFIDAVDTLEAQGMKSLIIDLRDNGGGFVDVCVDMVSRIIPEDQLIVYTEDKNGKKTEYKSNSEKELNIPIIILVNGNTASASEIMTGCLKDYGVANVVGSQTYGKGIVQNNIGLSDGSAIKLTVAKYYTPNGNDIHKKGIEPDVIVEMEDAQWKEARDDETKDTQLQKAYELLK